MGGVHDYGVREASGGCVVNTFRCHMRGNVVAYFSLLT